jgi:hypothetical protein
MLEVSALAAWLRAKMQLDIAIEDLLEQRRERALAAVRRLQELCRPLDDAPARAQYFVPIWPIRGLRGLSAASPAGGVAADKGAARIHLALLVR